MFTSRLFLQFAAIFALGVVLAACAPTSMATSTLNESPMKATVVEIITFRLPNGVTDATFIAANQRVESEYVKRQPGFISRETARGDNGEWLVIVHWASLADADTSMASFATAPATAGFMAAIDAPSMTMKRYTLQN